MAGVEQPGDVRVRQPRHDLPLAREALGAAGGEHARGEELDRHLAFVAAVGAARQPDAAHAAAAELAHQRVGADGLAGHVRWRLHRRGLQEAAAVQRFELCQPGLHLGGECRVGVVHHGQVLGTLRGGQLDQLVEQRRQFAPACAIRLAGGHQRSATDRYRRAFCQSRCTVRSVTPRFAAISGSLRPPK
jgi:hypothetical protein